MARQAPLSMGFSRQEYWSGLPFPLLGDLPDPSDQTYVSVFCIAGGSIVPTELTGKALGTIGKLLNTSDLSLPSHENRASQVAQW